MLLLTLLKSSNGRIQALLRDGPKTFLEHPYSRSAKFHTGLLRMHAVPRVFMEWQDRLPQVEYHKSTFD